MAGRPVRHVCKCTISHDRSITAQLAVQREVGLSWQYTSILLGKTDLCCLHTGRDSSLSKWKVDKYSYVISFNDSTTKLKHYQYRRIDTFGHFTKFDTRQIFHYTIYVYVCVLQLTVHIVLYTVHECIFPTAIWRKTAEGELGIPWWAWWKRERWARERRPR